MEEGDRGTLLPGLRERTFGNKVVKETTFRVIRSQVEQTQTLGVSVHFCYSPVNLCRDYISIMESAEQANGTGEGKSQKEVVVIEIVPNISH